MSSKGLSLQVWQKCGSILAMVMCTQHEVTAFGMRNSGNQTATTKLITLRVPTSQLPLITQFAQQHGLTRSKLLIDGAKFIMKILEDMEGQNTMPNPK